MVDSPVAWLLVVGGLGVVLLWIGRTHMARSLLSIVALCFLLVAVLPVEEWALRPLEDRFQRPADLSSVDGIVLLGGAIEAALSADRGETQTNGAADRILQFAVLARRFPAAQLVFTGGPLPASPAGPREADWARPLFSDLGIDPARIIVESDSRTTAENAMFTAKLIHPQPAQHWLLLTSAAHMPRAMGVFRQQGLDLMAYPVGYKTYRGAVGRPYGLAEKLRLLNLAAHEWIGLAVYYLRGQSTALFPAPLPPPEVAPVATQPPAPAPIPAQPSAESPLPAAAAPAPAASSPQ